MADRTAETEPLVCVMTLSWNDAQNTLDCLRSVYELEYTCYRVLVVDNGSSEDTVRAIRSAFPQVELIVNPSNLGFGGGANVGFDRAREHGVDYVLFVNSDTVVDPALLRELVRSAETRPQAGLLVPKIYTYDGARSGEPGRIWSAGARWAPFPPRVKMIGMGRRDQPRYDQPRQLEYATGCALLVRREVLETVGGFDPIFWPAYQEDYDFSARVIKAGWEIWYVPAARLWHKETRSRQKQGAWNKAFNLGKNTVPLFVRHIRPALASLLVHVFWVLIREALKFNWPFIGPYVAGVRAGWARHRRDVRRGEESR
jgi:GT2 family glycosyltransferase